MSKQRLDRCKSLVASAWSTTQLFLVLFLSFSKYALADPRVGSEVILQLGAGQSVRVSVALKHAPVGETCKNRLELNEAVGRSQNKILALLSNGDVRVLHRYRSVFGLSLQLHSSAALQRLLSSSDIVRIDQDVGGQGGLAQSMPLVKADQIHALGNLGAGRTLALIDTGIDNAHADLAPAIVDQHCFCSTNCCPNGLSEMAGVNSAQDDHGHGTHVAGIMLSRGISSAVGMAPGANIVVVKALDSGNSFSSSADIVAALDWIYNNHPEVDAINMSLYTNTKFASTCDSTFAWTLVWANAVDNLKAIGVLSVGIAGNDGLTGQAVAPGCFSSAVMVGNSSKTDIAFGSSNSSSMVDLFAPGVSINSDRLGGGTIAFTGTSMSAPHVAGATALLRKMHPSATTAQIWAALTTSAVTIDDGKGLVRPRLQLLSAAARLDSFFPSPTVTPTTTLTPTFTVSGTITLTPTISPTPTLVLTVGLLQPVSGNSPPSILSALVVPNPLTGSQGWLAFELSGNCTAVECSLYSSGYVLVKSWRYSVRKFSSRMRQSPMEFRLTLPV